MLCGQNVAVFQVTVTVFSCQTFEEEMTPKNLSSAIKIFGMRIQNARRCCSVAAPRGTIAEQRGEVLYRMGQWKLSSTHSIITFPVCWMSAD
jgi:hypothetical protein